MDDPVMFPRSWRLGLGAAAVAAAVALWFLVLSPALTTTDPVTLGRGDYMLAATDGGEFTQASLKGHPSAVFFGFTHCPEVCPTTLGDIATWSAELGPDAAKFRFWFVTVDPERDTVELLRDYVSWTPGVTGAAGAPDEVAEAVSAFRVYARKVPLDNGDYTMDHSASMMLFDRTGRFAGLIRYQEETASAVAKLRQLISEG